MPQLLGLKLSDPLPNCPASRPSQRRILAQFWCERFECWSSVRSVSRARTGHDHVPMSRCRSYKNGPVHGQSPQVWYEKSRRAYHTAMSPCMALACPGCLSAVAERATGTLKGSVIRYREYKPWGGGQEKNIVFKKSCAARKGD